MPQISPEDKARRLREREERAKTLPPIAHIKEPHFDHQSTRIRWLWELGYEVKEIHHHTGIRYQQVRNVVTTEPKRAAREDLPALVIEVLDPETDLEAMEAQADFEQLAAAKAESRGERRAINKRRRELVDNEVDEITEKEE